MVSLSGRRALESAWRGLCHSPESPGLGPRARVRGHRADPSDALPQVSFARAQRGGGGCGNSRPEPLISPSWLGSLNQARRGWWRMGPPGVGSVLASSQPASFFALLASQAPHHHPQHKSSCRSPSRAAATPPCSAWGAAGCPRTLWVISPRVLFPPLLFPVLPAKSKPIPWLAKSIPRDQTQTSLISGFSHLPTLILWPPHLHA